MHGFQQLHSIKFTRIVAIDLGKFNSVVCLYDPATTEHSFVTIQTIPQTVRDLLVERAGEDPSQTLVVFETCDCGGWVYDIAHGMVRIFDEEQRTFRTTGDGESTSIEGK